MTRGVAPLGALVAWLGGCVPNWCAPLPPDERTFPPGRFAYEAHAVPPGRADTVTWRGTVVLDRVLPDSLVGHWEVRGYLPHFAQADYTVRSYYFTALALDGGDTLVVSHYLARVPGAPAAAPGCRLTVATRTAGAHADGRCRLTRLAPP